MSGVVAVERGGDAADWTGGGGGGGGGGGSGRLQAAPRLAAACQAANPRLASTGRVNLNRGESGQPDQRAASGAKVGRAPHLAAAATMPSALGAGLDFSLCRAPFIFRGASTDRAIMAQQLSDEQGACGPSACCWACPRGLLGPGRLV